ncbi:MAG: hypothetical protein FJ314_05435 [SAR202 cluster bacterium]|nr:hypothetical protein [SAR202 cluster bacterium]
MSAMRLAIAALLVSFVMGCSSFSPPENCPFGGGTADPEAFATSFSEMSIRRSDGSPGVAGRDAEYRFAAQDQLEIVATSLGKNQIAICVGERKGGGKLVLNTTVSVEQGPFRFPLGDHARGPYVVRVAVGGKIVRNLTFEVE